MLIPKPRKLKSGNYFISADIGKNPKRPAIDLIIGGAFGLFASRGDPYGTRTRVSGVKGRCLNHLTNGPARKYGDM